MGRSASRSPVAYHRNQSAAPFGALVAAGSTRVPPCPSITMLRPIRPRTFFFFVGGGDDDVRSFAGPVVVPLACLHRRERSFRGCWLMRARAFPGTSPAPEPAEPRLRRWVSSIGVPSFDLRNHTSSHEVQLHLRSGSHRHRPAPVITLTPRTEARHRPFFSWDDECLWKMTRSFFDPHSAGLFATSPLPPLD